MALSDDQEALQQQYRTRFNDSESYRNKLWQILARQFFQQYIDASKPVIDIGCGWGEFANNVDANSKFAMDLNPDSRQIPVKCAGRYRFAQPICPPQFFANTATD